jgi:hypothetical protein
MPAAEGCHVRDRIQVVGIQEPFTGDCPDFRGAVVVAMQKTLDCRENGTVPLALREGDRSMFSANRLFPKHVRTPKNGPVPDHDINGYQEPVAAGV